MEVFRLPENAPRTAFFAAHPKGGQLAGDYAEDLGITWVKEARSAIDPTADNSFSRTVELANVSNDTKSCEKIVDEQAMKQRGVNHVVSTLDMIDLRKAVETYRDAIASKGNPTLSPRAFLALQVEWFRRNASSLVVRPGWENHPDEVTLVIEAVKMATGLSKGAYDGADFRMEVFEYDANSTAKNKMKKPDLYDIVSTLGNKVEKYLDGNIGHISETMGMTPEEFGALQNSGQLSDEFDVPAPAKDEIRAMARLLKITDMYADPGRVNREYKENHSDGSWHQTDEIVDWSKVDADFIRFWHNEPNKREQLMGTQKNGEETMRDRLRRKLLTVGILQLEGKEDMKGLDNGIDNSYEAAWRKTHNTDKILKRSKTENRVYLKKRGVGGGPK